MENIHPWAHGIKSWKVEASFFLNGNLEKPGTIFNCTFLKTWNRANRPHVLQLLKYLNWGYWQINPNCSAPTRPYFRDFFPNRDFLEKVVPIQSLFQELVPIPKNRAKNYQKLTKLGPKCHFLTLKSIFFPRWREISFKVYIFTVLNKLLPLCSGKTFKMFHYKYHFKLHLQLSKVKKSSHREISLSL